MAPAAGLPSSEGRTRLRDCRDRRISSLSVRRPAAPCVSREELTVPQAAFYRKHMRAPLIHGSRTCRTTHTHGAETAGTWQRRRSTSVSGCSWKGTGTATGGQGPATLTTVAKAEPQWNRPGAAAPPARGLSPSTQISTSMELPKMLVTCTRRLDWVWAVSPQAHHALAG